MNSRAEPSRRQAVQSASRADVQKALASETLDFKPLLERILGFGYSVLIHKLEEAAPILAELEPFARSDFSAVKACCCIDSYFNHYILADVLSTLSINAIS